jgi:hypothetical protein
MRSIAQHSALIGLALGSAFLATGCQRSEDASNGDSPGAAACCELAPAADLPPGKGRILVAYPGDNIPTSTRLDIYARGDTTRSLASDNGPARLELDPGTYDATLGGKRVAGIVVEAGHETRILAGVVQVFAGTDTRIDFYDVSGDSALASGYGKQTYGFPAGEIEVEVVGQRETLTIADGKVTEF